MQNIITSPPPSDFEIDSFRLKIPFEKCKILSPELNQLYLTINSNTSEIISKQLNNKINVGTDYMKLWVQIKSINDRLETIEYHENNFLLDKEKSKPIVVAPTQFVIVTIHSKLLKSDYLDRITWNNIESVYNMLMSYKVFYCDYHTFLHSDILDIDFCRNVQIPNWSECKSYIIEHLKPSTELGRGINEFNQKDNIGLQFGTRENSSYTKPYIKIYHKYIELTTKSKLFAERYLSKQILGGLHSQNYVIDIPTDLFRVEYTLKDKKHYQKYNLYKQVNGKKVVANSLSDMLSLSNEKKEYIASHMFSYQFVEGIYKMKPAPKKKFTYSQGRNAMYQQYEITTPKHLYVYMLLQSIKEYGDAKYNLSLIIDELESVGFNKRTLQRSKKEIYSMFSKLSTKEQDIILDKENEYKRIMLSVQKSIEQIGINELHYFGKKSLKSEK